MTPAELVRAERLVGTQVNAIFDCAAQTPLGPCVFPSGHGDGHVGMLDPTPLCRACNGETCAICRMTGLAP